MSIIEIIDLSFGYDRQYLFQHLNVSIEAKDYIAIAGPNGSGKSTLIRCLLGFISNFEGEIKKKEHLRIGYLPQNIQRNDHIFPATVYEIIAMGTLKDQRGRKKIDKASKLQISHVLKELNIEHLKDKKMSELSGGQQQRVLLGRALVGKPNVLVLDEPTSALDPLIREEFYHLIKKLNQEQAITILLVTHDLSSVESQANRLLYIDQKGIYDGNFLDYYQSKVKFVKEEK